MAHDVPPQNDYNDHRQTYDAFIGMTKWTTIGVIVLLILMAMFLL